MDNRVYVVLDGDCDVVGVFDSDEGAWEFVQFHNPDQWNYSQFTLNEPYN